MRKRYRLALRTRGCIEMCECVIPGHAQVLTRERYEYIYRYVYITVEAFLEAVDDFGPSVSITYAI